MCIQHIHKVNFNTFLPNCQGFFADFMKISKKFLTKRYLCDILNSVVYEFVSRRDGIGRRAGLKIRW